MAKKWQNKTDNFDIDPFLGFREQIIKERGEDAKPRSYLKKSRTQSRNQAEAIKLLTLKWFQLIEPNLFWAKDGNVLSTAHFRGTEIFDIKARSRQSLCNPHLELDIMRKDRIRVLFQHRRGFDKDNMNVTLPLQDFELILDAMALMVAENKYLNGVDPNELTREQIYQGGIRDTIQSMLDLRNNKIDALRDFKMIKKLDLQESSNKPLTPYFWFDGMSYRYPEDYELKFNNVSDYLSDNSLLRKDWMWTRESLKNVPKNRRDFNADDKAKVLTYRSNYLNKINDNEPFRHSMLSQKGEFWYMFNKENPDYGYVWRYISKKSGLKVYGTGKFIMYWRPKGFRLDLGKTANTFGLNKRIPILWGLSDRAKILQILRKFERLKLIKLSHDSGNIYKITFTYYSKDTKQKNVNVDELNKFSI